MPSQKESLKESDDRGASPPTSSNKPPLWFIIGAVGATILITYCLLAFLLEEKRVEVWFTGDYSGGTFENVELVRDSWGRDVTWQQPYLDRFKTDEGYVFGEWVGFTEGRYYVHVSIGKKAHLCDFGRHTFGR